MKCFLIISSLLLSLHSNSQEEESARRDPKPNLKVIYPTTDHFDIWDLRFGNAVMIPQGNDIGLNYFSFNFGAHYLYEFNLSRNRSLSFALGAGYDFQRIHLAGFFEPNENKPLVFDESTSSRSNIHAVSFPAELRFRIKQNWKVYLGYQLLIPFAANNNYSLNGQEGESEIKEIISFQNGPFLRLGFKDFFLFSRLNFTPLFLTNDHQVVKFFQFGISLGG